jgi:hypothetical protein
LRVQALLAEYNSLRQESLTSINNRITIANFTFGAVAVILAGLIAQARPNLVTGLVSLFFVPQVSKTGLLIWLGEYNRSQRAGRWLKDVERRINDTLGRPAMTWEGALLSQGVHMGYPYLATVLLLLGAGWAGSVIGVYILFERVPWQFFQHNRVWMILACALYAVANELLFARFFRKKWRDIRRHYSPAGPPVWSQ